MGAESEAKRGWEHRVNVLDLFSGIGGFSLGLERAGMRTTAFCEIDPFCRKVLARHWPGVPIYDDIRKLDGIYYAGAVDLVCGGFPCQDLSVGHTWTEARGLDGERSGLWFEFQRLIGEIRPRWAIIENVSILRSRGLDTVLGSLAEIGYDAEWHCIAASALGARHERDRVWIVAHPAGERVEGLWPEGIQIAHPLAHPFLPLRDRNGEWQAEPDVCRVADGVPDRAHRLKAVGNAVVPQIPEFIGRAILAYERQLGLAA